MRTKRPIERIPSLPEAELLERIKGIPEPYRSYAVFTYLFGNRVSEPLGKKVSTVNKRGVVEDSWEYKPIFKTNFEVKDGFLIVHNVTTLKRKGKPVREAYVDITGTGEKEFVDLLMDWVNNKEPLEPLWTHSRKTQWKYVDKHLGIPPHKLRGMRATKDAVEYHLDAIDLKRKFNWATEKMAMHYAAKDPRDIMKKMRQSR